MKRLLNWFRLRNLESDLDRELKYHIERRVSDLMLSGLPEPEARRQATLELGGVTQVQEEVRDIWLVLPSSSVAKPPEAFARQLR